MRQKIFSDTRQSLACTVGWKNILFGCRSVHNCTRSQEISVEQNAIDVVSLQDRCPSQETPISFKSR